MKPFNTESAAVTGSPTITTIILHLPETGFLRLSQIVGYKKKGEPAVRGMIPVSAATWWLWVRSGKAPKPKKLGPMTTVWRVEDIRKLIERIAEDPIQKERDETVEHADGLLGGFGAGEATKASSMPAVSEPSREPLPRPEAPRLGEMIQAQKETIGLSKGARPPPNWGKRYPGF